MGFGKKNKKVNDDEVTSKEYLDDVEEVEDEMGEEDRYSAEETAGRAYLSHKISQDDEDELTAERLTASVIEYFTTVEIEWLNSFETGSIPKKVFVEHVHDYIRNQTNDKDKQDAALAGFVSYIWSYGILDELINDPSISDIKTYRPDRIRVKRNGHRETSTVRFMDERSYTQYISRVAVKNKVNISNQNAMQTFTDKSSNPDYILRFNISTAFINSHGMPMLHIRKIPKKKYTTEEFIKFGFFTEKQVEYLKDRAANSDGILVAGKGGSGKTYLLNWLIDYIPEDKSGLVIQENEELFTWHPDILRQHTVENRGEGKISYSLQDLARNGLLIDLDYFIIGEIKGGEALYLLNAVYTGHKGWASIHGASSTEALDKLVDYIKYNSTYSKEEALKMLVHMGTIVFMKDFHVAEISEVKGFNEETGKIEYKRVF